MGNFFLMQKCALVNFRKWAVTPQIWITLAAAAIMMNWNLSGVLEYSRASGIRVTPWVLPHFFSMPIMMTVFSAITVILFAHAPFRDEFTQFLEIRMGKGLWIRAQVLYILEAAAVYTFFYVIVIFLICLPRIYFTAEWGTLLTQLAVNREDAASYGIELEGIAFSPHIINAYAAPEAMGLTCLMIWMVSSFLGFLIFGCNILIGHGAGIMAAGFFSFLSYFCNYAGWMTFGSRIFYFSPVNWIYLNYLDGAGGPDLFYAVAFLTVQMIFWGTLGIRVYQIKEEG